MSDFIEDILLLLIVFDYFLLVDRQVDFLVVQVMLLDHRHNFDHLVTLANIIDYFSKDTVCEQRLVCEVDLLTALEMVGFEVVVAFEEKQVTACDVKQLEQLLAENLAQIQVILD